MKRKKFIVLVVVVATVFMMSACSNKQNDNELKTQILTILDNTKVYEGVANTIGSMVVKVFNKYEIDYEETSNSNKYKVTISGEYYLNPAIPNLVQNGSITYLVDIENNSCITLSDPQDITSTFLVFIFN